MELPFYVATHEHGICKERSDQGPLDYQTIFSVFIVIFAIVLIAISSYCLCKNWANSSDFSRRERRSEGSYGLTPHGTDARAEAHEDTSSRHSSRS